MIAKEDDLQEGSRGNGEKQIILREACRLKDLT
jgi:hypothetical protein